MISGYAKAVRILLTRMYFIFKRISQVRKISARWIPHVLIYDQNRYPSNVSQIQTIFDHCYWYQKWIFYFEPARNKTWQTTHGKSSEDQLPLILTLDSTRACAD